MGGCAGDRASGERLGACVPQICCLTDPARDGNGYFMSAQPRAEHHQLLLLGGGKGDGKQLQQLSFHTGSLAEVREFYRRLKAAGARINRTITHGNAVSVYFYDPSGNRLQLIILPPGGDGRARA